MDNVLMSSEVDFYIQTMMPQKMESLGTTHWLEWHQRLQKLNQQAVVEASCMREEYVKETLTTYGKIPVLVHEAILINLWKYKVLPQLLRIDHDPEGTFLAYSILYHEAVCVNLLELVMFHASAAEALEDAAHDLQEYAYGAVSKLLVCDDGDEDKQELIKQRDELGFEIGIRCLTILRYLAENLDRLPLGVTAAMYDNDVPVLLVEVVLTHPWIRGDKQYSKGKWITWDYEAVTSAAAQRRRVEGVKTGSAIEYYRSVQWAMGIIRNLQIEVKINQHRASLDGYRVWLTLRQLLLGPNRQNHYDLTQSRRSQLMKLQPVMTPVLLDQISPLVELSHWLCRLAAGEQPAASHRPVLLETVPQIKSQILETYGGKWKKIAREQLPVVFCRDKEKLLETAQMLSEAFNTDLLEKFDDSGTKNQCAGCGKVAIQRCSRCKKDWYCSRSCQMEQWQHHKVKCEQAQSA